jgi:hypothetical protein
VKAAVGRPCTQSKAKRVPFRYRAGAPDATRDLGWEGRRSNAYSMREILLASRAQTKQGIIKSAKVPSGSSRFLPVRARSCPGTPIQCSLLLTRRQGTDHLRFCFCRAATLVLASRTFKALSDRIPDQPASRTRVKHLLFVFFLGAALRRLGPRRRVDKGSKWKPFVVRITLK